MRKNGGYQFSVMNCEKEVRLPSSEHKQYTFKGDHSCVISKILPSSQRKLRGGNVFTGVCLSVHRGGSPCNHYPWCIGPHCTGPPDPPGHQTLDQPQTSGVGPPAMARPWRLLLVTCGGDHWRPVNTCSFGASVSKWAIRIVMERFLVDILR